MLISIITPIHKIKYINNAINNFLRQNYINKELVIILNGECLDYDKNILCNNIHVLRTDNQNISTIRNIGLDWANKNNRKTFSCFDSDDFYGSNYLTEAFKKLSEGYKLVGKLNYTATYNNDQYKITGLVEDGMIHGPTITGYVTNQRYNEQYNNLAEDIEYVSKFGKNEIGYTSENNWRYSVHSNSIQHRSLEHFLEGIKFHNTQNKNQNCKIYKNGKLYWEYGNGYDLNKLCNHTQINIETITQHHLSLLEIIKKNELV